MPYIIRKMMDHHFQVVNADSREVKAKHTTKANAEKQVRLLNAIEHGFVPRKK